MKQRLIPFLALGIASIPVWAFGQNRVERFERQLEQIRRDTRLEANTDLPLDQRVLVDYGGWVSVNYLTLDDDLSENHVLWQYELGGFARVNIDAAHEFFVRGATGYRDYNDGDSFDGRGDQSIDGDFDRAYYRFDLARYRASYDGVVSQDDLIVQAGRDLVFWHNGLVLSLELDGARVGVLRGPVQLDLIAGITPVRTVDFDASRSNFDYNTRRGFYGASASASVGVHQPFVYFLAQQDYNDAEDVISGVPTSFDYNSYYLGIGSAASLSDRLRVGIEAVYQFGTTLSNSFEISGPSLEPIDQTEDDISAWAADVQMDYLIPHKYRSRLGLEALISSGDDDRLSTSNTFGGNEPGTTDEAFNAFGLINTGLAFGANVSNLMMLRVGAATLPFVDSASFSALQTGIDFFLFGKTIPAAPIDQFTYDERFLGTETDLYINWQITSDLSLALRYGAFFPSSGAFAIDDVRHFFFSGLTFSF